jgi:proteasome assembly chaperone (PAC2) family protein
MPREATRMTALNIIETPELRDPILIAAFAGWSDAGGAATAAASYLVERWRAPRLADIDAEDFYDFTQLRPTVRYTEGNNRRIDWPENAFTYHQTPERDLILFNGIEPHLHWKAYSQTFIEAIERFKIKLVITLGSMFVDYPHTRPIRITGSAPEPEMLERAGIVNRGNRGRYEGPTGINGVIGARLRELEIPAASIWANVPHYVSATPNPPASLALLRSLTAMLSVEVPLGRLVRASAAFDEQLNEATSKNSEVLEYVKSLEERIDAEALGNEPAADLPATESIVKDIEDFLRRTSGEGQ